ncbi:MAG: 2-oxoacid:acceptor oxidoreductase subunit alpha [Gammaproteobacteria bacterium]
MPPDHASQLPLRLSVAVTGSGGSGAVTTGLGYLEAAARAGLYGLMNRSAGPQIRGGESAAMLRLGTTPVACMDDYYDFLVGLDWLNIDRFTDEIPLNSGSRILADPDAGELPEALTATGAQVIEAPFREQAKTVTGGRLNMVALGTLGAASGIPRETMQAALRSVLGDKGEAVMSSSLACLALGYELGSANAPAPLPAVLEAPWNISGNEACGLGALRGGVRFVAAYPITPASEMLEWMAPRLEQLGGSLLQAEDELASVNMIIGASFGGVPALTATSGPGLSLMMEGLGLAVTSETPTTVVNVMRGGPSTGIPTKSEQADLNIALFGLHGDAPHLVLAPLDIADCVFTTEWAVRLAEHLQTVAIVLSDQSLGQSRAITPAPGLRAPPLERRRLDATPDRYHRYSLADGDVSAMSVPGQACGMYTADGLEHNEHGTPSSRAIDHLEQMEKRSRKLHAFAYGERWAEIDGDGELCLVTWGSSAGAALEAADRLRRGGTPTRVVALRLLMPLQRSALLDALAGASAIWVIEQNHGGQLFHYLVSEDALPGSARSLARPGPLPLRPGEIVTAISEA